jgi:nitroreductase
MIRHPQQDAVDAAITTRRSIRAFLPDPVAREDIEQILNVAARAPSGTNTQPWQVHVLQGAAKTALSEAILAVYHDPVLNAQHTEEYPYYPRAWKSPFIDRRRKVGWDLYTLMGLTRDNKEGGAACAQFPLFRRACRADVYHRPDHGAGLLARLRHVLAEHHGSGARTRPRHVSAGGVYPISQNHCRPFVVVPRPHARVWHGAWLGRFK